MAFEQTQYPGYLINKTGEVYSEKSKKIMKLDKLWTGYLRVHCYGYKRVYVHRLVAIAFLPNPLNKKYVNHINGVKHDNRAENLEWVSCSENLSHARHVLKINFGPHKGVKNHNAKLNPDIVLEMKKMRISGAIYQKIAAHFKVDYKTAYRAINNLTWSV